MKIKGNNKNIYIVVAIAALLLFGGVFMLVSSRSPNLADLSQTQKITVETKDGKLTVYRDGRVFFDNGTETLTETWDPDKVNTFFKYFLDKYGYSDEYVVSEGDTLVFTGEGGEKTVVIPTDEELVDAVEEDVSDGDSGDGDDGEDIGDYFGSPTPSPTSGPGGGTPVPTYPPGGAPEGCLYWRLSFCSQWQPPPTFTPTPSPDLEALPPTCDDERNKEGGHTVVTDSKCLILPDELQGE